jgi:hypothetical protein
MNSSDIPIIQLHAARIQQLEAENRGLKRMQWVTLILALLLPLAPAAYVAAARKAPVTWKTLRAETIELVGADGKTRTAIAPGVVTLEGGSAQASLSATGTGGALALRASDGASIEAATHDNLAQVQVNLGTSHAFLEASQASGADAFMWQEGLDTPNAQLASTKAGTASLSLRSSKASVVGTAAGFGASLVARDEAKAGSKVGVEASDTTAQLAVSQEGVPRLGTATLNPTALLLQEYAGDGSALVAPNAVTLGRGTRTLWSSSKAR